MFSKQTIGGGFAALAFCGAASAQTVTIQPGPTAGKDATIYQGFPNDNLDAGATNPALGPFIGFLVVSQTSSGNDLQSVLEFDLASLAGTDAADVTDASVRLYALQSTVLPFFTANPTPTASIDLNLYEVTQPWSETTVTWNNPPFSRSGDGTPALPIIDTITLDGFNQFIDFDVTAVLQNALLTAQSTVSFAIASPTAVTGANGREVSLVAYSSEAPGTVLGPPGTSPVPGVVAPSLVVNLIPEPAAAAVLALAVPLLRRRRR